MVTAKVKIFVLACELGENECQLLFIERSFCEVGLLKCAGIRGGNLLFETLVRALISKLLDASAAILLAYAVRMIEKHNVLFDLVDEVQLDAFLG